MPQMHNNRPPTIPYITIFWQWHLRQLIWVNMELPVIKDRPCPKRGSHLEINGRASKQGIDRIWKLLVCKHKFTLHLV